ncbi:MAG: AmmeMemoRadiSam system protein B [Prevotella sp.]|nr:AmmeMemoRadiSam system protein B [Prevotella sp.]
MEKKIRRAAVAGQFYAAEATELRRDVKGFLNRHYGANAAVKGPIRALIVPHAGYVFSGDIAASAYACLPPENDYEHIFILGPSHRIYLNQLSVGRDYVYETPLGKVEVDQQLCATIIQSCDVFTFDERAHIQEHCIEVQLPFLQVQLKRMPTIVPIVVATQDTEVLRKAAKALLPYFNERNLFIISSDFSHYPTYEIAKRVDKLTGDAIMSGKVEKFMETISKVEHKREASLSTCACGEAAIALLLMLSGQATDITIYHTGYCNSGDSEYGSKQQVVGYHSFVFAEKKFTLSNEDMQELKKIATESIREVFTGRTYRPQNLSKSLLQYCGAFVTLYENGRLRGCIGHLGEDTALHQIVKEMAHASAFEDPRFYPLDESEMGQINIEISVITPMKRITSIDEFLLGQHGIFMRKGHHTGTFLPQVARETNWTKEEFLGHCAQDKAGIGWEGWRDAELYTYEAIVF